MPPRSSITIPEKDTPTIEKEKTIGELRQEALDGVLQISQFICLAFGDLADAGAIGVFCPPMANETVKLADTNSKVAAKVDLLIEMGPYAGLVAATIPFLAQLFVNRKIFKAEQFANAGVLPPELLETKMKTEMLHKAAQVRREQMEAQERFQRLEEEMLKNANGDSPEKDAPIND